jgi:hypothetical protein
MLGRVLQERLIQKQEIMLIGVIIRDIQPQIRIEKNQQIQRMCRNWLGKQTCSNQDILSVFLYLTQKLFNLIGRIDSLRLDNDRFCSEFYS